MFPHPGICFFEIFNLSTPGNLVEKVQSLHTQRNAFLKYLISPHPRTIVSEKFNLSTPGNLLFKNIQSLHNRDSEKNFSEKIQSFHTREFACRISSMSPHQENVFLKYSISPHPEKCFSEKFNLSTENNFL